MGLFRRSVDVKNATKTTYSEDDLKKQFLQFDREFQVKLGHKVLSPYRKEKPQVLMTQMRERAFEKALDDRLYTFKHLLVVPNPYGVCIQSALLLFNTPKSCKVRYTVLGKQPGADFTGETQYRTRHRVAVLGLYHGYTNKLKLELIDENGTVISRRDLTIYCGGIPLSVQHIITHVEHQDDSRFPFMLINGQSFNPIAVDQYGEVRYSIQMKTSKLGMIPLEKGRFLYADRQVNRVGFDGRMVPCLYHEMDYMGRIYHTYQLEESIGGAIAFCEEYLYMMVPSKLGYDGDEILCLDRRTGEVAGRIRMEDVLGTRYQEEGFWCPVTCMVYRDGYLYLTLKHQHTILKLHAGSHKVEWVLAPKGVWEDTPLEDKLLTNRSGQDALVLTPEECTITSVDGNICNLLLFGIQTSGKVAVKDECEDEDHSRIVRCQVDEHAGTFTLIKSLNTRKCYRAANVLVTEDGDRVMATCGEIDDWSEDQVGVLMEIDTATGEERNRMDLNQDFRKCWEFAPEIASYDDPVPQNNELILGKISAPAGFKGQLEEPAQHRIRKKFFGRTHLQGDLFIFAFAPGDVKKVYLMGEKHKFVQDYSALKKRIRKQSFAISLEELPQDEYVVYVRLRGELYRLKNEIRIQDKKKKS